MKKWNCLIYNPEEVGEDEHWILEAIEGERLILLEQNSGQELFQVLSKGKEAGGEGLAPENCLMLAGTDVSLSLAHKWRIASVVFRRADEPEQEFKGESFVLEGLEGLDHRLLQRRYERYHGIPWTIAETQRCVLRELSIEDVPTLYELYAKPHMTDYMEPLYPWEEEIEYQKQYIQYVYHFYEFGMWLIFEKATGRLIGRAGLEPREYPNWEQNGPKDDTCRDIGEEPEFESVIELGYLIDPDYQRQGYATEVCTQIIRTAKADYGIRELHSLIRPGNIASMAVARRLGFRYIGNMHMDGKSFQHYIL